MCHIFSISRSGFYSCLRRTQSHREQANEELVAQIRQIHKESGQTYGSPRITAALHQRGICCNKKRIARLMRIKGIVPKTKKKFKVTTCSAHKRPIVNDLVKRQFTASLPDKVWTSDITYIWTRQGWLYLSVFLDVCSRRIVGWAMKGRMTDQLVTDAFKQAIMHRKVSPGLIVHSDRGSQYRSRFFKELLDKTGCHQSMSATGNCYDNAITESFFATLKKEHVFHERYKIRYEAKRSIFKYIEMFYNRKRLHSSLGGLSPHQYEQSLIHA